MNNQKIGMIISRQQSLVRVNFWAPYQIHINFWRLKLDWCSYLYEGVLYISFVACPLNLSTEVIGGLGSLVQEPPSWAHLGSMSETTG